LRVGFMKKKKTANLKAQMEDPQNELKHHLEVEQKWIVEMELIPEAHQLDPRRPQGVMGNFEALVLPARSFYFDFFEKVLDTALGWSGNKPLNWYHKGGLEAHYFWNWVRKRQGQESFKLRDIANYGFQKVSQEEQDPEIRGNFKCFNHQCRGTPDELKKVGRKNREKFKNSVNEHCSLLEAWIFVIKMLRRMPRIVRGDFDSEEAKRVVKFCELHPASVECFEEEKGEDVADENGPVPQTVGWGPPPAVPSNILSEVSNAEYRRHQAATLGRR